MHITTWLKNFLYQFSERQQLTGAAPRPSPSG
jgi:hypothetical protein